jgi:uracil-DNA glycosylase
VKKASSLFLDSESGDNQLREPLANLFAAVPPGWRAVTDRFQHSEAGRALIEFVDARVKAGATIYPTQVFRALSLTAPADVRVVILGQDPYHGPGQAQGLAFSIAAGQKPAPSLRNILAEVAADTGAPSACITDLTAWAEQGVLLLNAVLTVEDGQPQSHALQGWEGLTDALLQHVAAQADPVVFMLWGAAAQRKQVFIDADRHRVLVANHPSPLSARRPPLPFMGCRHFSQANVFLTKSRGGGSAINW